MKQIALLAAVLTTAGTTACSGQYSGNGAEADANPGEAAQAFFTANVQPVLEQNCITCHAGSPTGPTFMTPPDIYGSLKAYPNLVVPGDAPASRLYAYGRSDQHSGPIFNAEQAETVRQWIEMEPSTGVEPPPTETTHFRPLIGENVVDLAPLGMGLEGASLTFVAQQLAAGIYITNLTVHAGTGGVHLNHPLFVTFCPTRPAEADPVDSFYGLDLIVDPGQTGIVGGGTVVLVDFMPDCELSVNFKVIEPGQSGPGDGDGGVVGGGGGCTDVPAFTANAQGPLSASCGGCHAGGNQTAKNAWDLSSIDDLSPLGQAAVCAQSRLKINLALEANSIMFQRVAPGQMTGHPLTLNQANYDAFKNPVLVWAVSEL